MSDGDCFPFCHVGGHDAGSLARRSSGEPREWIIERVGGDCFPFFLFLRAEQDDVDPLDIGGNDADSLAGRSPGHPVHVPILYVLVYLNLVLWFPVGIHEFIA